MVVAYIMDLPRSSTYLLSARRRMTPCFVVPGIDALCFLSSSSFHSRTAAVHGADLLLKNGGVGCFSRVCLSSTECFVAS